MRFTNKLMTALSITILLAAACTSAATNTTADPAQEDQTSDDQGTEDALETGGENKGDDEDEESAAAETAETDDGDGTAGFDLQDVVRRIGDGYGRIDGRWPGFVPTEHPTVLPLKTRSGELAGALAINFPDPDALGDARELDTEGTSIGSVHHITNPTDAEKLAGLNGFDFHFKVGGVDSFAMEAGGGDEFFDPTTNEYVATLLHEMFHRWQDDGFSGGLGSQDVEGYAYTAENLELAALEDRALIEGTTATTPTEREAAARRFAAIRLARVAADDRVKNLDNSQERFEGTARYIEHLLAGTDEDYASFHENDYSVELVADPSEAPGVKSHYGFGRFYATGAAILGLLDALDAQDVDQKIEDGLSPAEILINFMSVTSADVEELLEEARQNYDPLGELLAKATEAAESATSEPPVFGEEDFVGGGDDSIGGEGDGEGVEISDEEIECLADRGVDLLGGDQPGQEDIEACVSLAG